MSGIRTARRLAVLATVALLAGCTGPAAGPTGRLTLSERPLIGKFVWHDLVTDDVAEARRFYGRLFGWEYENTQHPGGGDYTLIKAGGRYLGGMVQRADDDSADYSRWLPYLSVADVDTAVGLTESAGGTAVVGPLDLGDIGRAAAVTDPQGAVLGLLRSRAGDPDDPHDTHFGEVYWNELLAADETAAADFYRSLAGYEVQTVARRGGEYRILQVHGRERAGVLRRPNENIEPQWLTHFAVTDVETAVRRAADLGGEVLLAPSPDVRDDGFAIVSDPTGAVLALTEFTP